MPAVDFGDKQNEIEKADSAVFSFNSCGARLPFFRSSSLAVPRDVPRDALNQILHEELVICLKRNVEFNTAKIVLDEGDRACGILRNRHPPPTESN
jgi:hypothetical protein